MQKIRNRGARRSAGHCEGIDPASGQHDLPLSAQAYLGILLTISTVLIPPES